MTKLNLKTIEGFGFDIFQNQLQEEKDNIQMLENDNDFSKRKKITTHHVYRFFPKLKARA